MEVLNIDTIGQVTRDAAENCYILVVIDCFTRFIELYPVSDISAHLCARVLLDRVCRYGTPMTIRSGRGTQFVNGIIKELLDLLQVEHEGGDAPPNRHQRVSDSWSLDYLGAAHHERQSS